MDQEDMCTPPEDADVVEMDPAWLSCPDTADEDQGGYDGGYE
jgi:hypothetical protein